MPTIKQRVIITPFHLPWDRPADYQRQTCLELAKSNLVIALDCHHPITSIELLKKLFFSSNSFSKKNSAIPTNKLSIVWVRPLMILPGSRWFWIKSLNWAINIQLLVCWQRLQKVFFPSATKTTFSKPIFWTFDPIFANLEKLLPNCTSVYDCVDFHQATDASNFTKLAETCLIKNTDIYVVNSQTLANCHRHIRMPNSITVQGFATDAYRKTQSSSRQLSSQKIAGFLGVIGDRLDYDLLIDVATKNQSLCFELFGPIDTPPDPNISWFKKLRHLLRLPNVHSVAPQPKSSLWKTINRWSVGLIPYDQSNLFNKHSFPMKLFEYFYLGMPVVATNLEELRLYSPYVAVAVTPQEFNNSVKQWIMHQSTLKQRKAMKDLALAHAYQHKVSDISQQILTFEYSKTVANNQL